MRCTLRRGILIFAVVALLLLVSCGKKECKVDGDCSSKSKNAFTAHCNTANYSCDYTPIPNVCGNGIKEQNENPCSCPADFTPCTGKVSGSQYLTQQCVKEQCTQDVNPSLVKPIFTSQEANSYGDKFKIDTVFNSPFNLKKDIFAVTFTLGQQGAQNREEHIKRVELLAQTKDKRQITLASQEVSKYLWTTGSKIPIELIIDFPSVDLEGQLTGLVLKVSYEYSQLQNGKKQPAHQVEFQVNYRDTFTFVRPEQQYACPVNCDDKNQGTRDVCGPQTNYFCLHEPIQGACGNSVCDGGENQCSCPQDCGPCEGSTGNFLTLTCKQNNCVPILKSGVTIQPNTLFDDRSLGPVQLNNNYKFNNPLSVKQDKFNLEFKVYKVESGISGVTIETVRLLEGQQQLAESTVNKELSETPTTILIVAPSIASPEEEHQITLGVWYKYTQEGNDKRGNFQKPLGRITLIDPQ